MGSSCCFSPSPEAGQTKAFVLSLWLGPSIAQGGKLLASQQLNFAATLRLNLSGWAWRLLWSTGELASRMGCNAGQWWPRHRQKFLPGWVPGASGESALLEMLVSKSPRCCYDPHLIVGKLRQGWQSQWLNTRCCSVAKQPGTEACESDTVPLAATLLPPPKLPFLMPSDPLSSATAGH